MPSLQDMQGEYKLVNIIEDWDVIEEYAGEKMGFYQRLDIDGKIEIKVQTGRVGYRKEFESESDKLLSRILEFCQRHRYIRVYENVRDDQFFK
jgi:hypothetical protein